MIAWKAGALLPLKARGIGSARVEGLSSYLVRLAVAHVVPTNVMVSRLLPEVLGAVSGRNVLSGRRGAWMNGNGHWARDVSSALGRLTLRRELESLTMLPWRRMLPTPRLLAARRRWCPECYREMRAEAGECWDPLVWALAPTVWCTVHDRYLSESCVSCARAQPWLPRDTAIGWCAWCGSELGVGEGHQGAIPASDSKPVSARIRWAAEVCGDLVASSGTGRKVSGPREVGRKVRRLLLHLDDGNQSAFARRFGVSLPTPRHWMVSGSIRFDYLLRICWGSGMHPSDLLFADG